LITSTQLIGKRLFDLVLSLLLFPFLIIPIILLVILATIDTKTFGLFRHERIGQQAMPFMIYKIRTLKVEPHFLGSLDRSATVLGKFLRQTKLDELPQLFNVIVGDMSFVGPRPDVKGFADKLEGLDRIVLQLKPGITGPATLKYKNEDHLLAMQDDAETYNRTIIWPDKVKINVNYIHNWSFGKDLIFILKSIIN